MTKAERQELASLLALLRGLLRQGSAREALSILDSIRARREPHSAIVRITRHLRDAQKPTDTPVHPGHRVECEPLRCVLTAAECVRRQVKTDAQRTQEANRGQGTDHPSCDTRKCEQGQSLRERLDSPEAVVWRGKGPGGRFDRIGQRGNQERTKERMRREGLLSDIPTVDGIPSLEDKE